MIEESDYSGIDRLTHRIAFSNRAIQLTAADIESVLFRSRFHHLPVEKPIFICSLPRAGTTLLLELLTKSPELASHTYRDMPFVMAPVLWASFSGRFRVRSDPKERAHGDGMQIDFDSPEAFEEVLWRAFWPKKFKGSTIQPWSEGESVRGFKEFFKTHIKKVIHVRSHGETNPTRYVSKNNANIARVGFLKRLFPNCHVVVPVRRPVDQALSLHRQHLRFLERHNLDAFSLTYMRDLGHLEFGKLHQPIGFPGMDGIMDRFSPDGLDYWVGYWRIAFQDLLDRAGEVTFVSYEDLCRGGPAGLGVLAEALGLDPVPLAEEAGDRLRAPKEYDVEAEALDSENLNEALEMYDRLAALSVV